MENKNRLISVVVLLFLSYYFGAFFLGPRHIEGTAIFSTLFLGFGIWIIVEGIIFVKKRENKDAMPLALLAIYISLFALFMGFGGLATLIFDLGIEGGPLQGIGFLLFFISAIIVPVLGIWALIKGITLIKRRENVRLGVISLIIGAIATVPPVLFLLGLIFSLLSAAIF